MINNYAITININPQTFMTIIGNPKKRLRWRNHGQDGQKDFIYCYFLNKCSDHNILMKDSAWELTTDGNIHCHALIEGIIENVYGLQEAFCLAVCPKGMGWEIKQRCFFIKNITDMNGWLDYLHKEDNHYIPSYNMFMKR